MISYYTSIMILSWMSLGVSAGCALAVNYDELTAEELVRESDKAMYEAKAAYYRHAGRDRRNRR